MGIDIVVVCFLMWLVVRRMRMLGLLGYLRDATLFGWFGDYVV